MRTLLQSELDQVNGAASLGSLALMYVLAAAIAPELVGEITIETLEVVAGVTEFAIDLGSGALMAAYYGGQFAYENSGTLIDMFTYMDA